MSIDQLVGSTIQLVVYIKEGHGFGFLTSPIKVTSSLLGHVLATDVELASPDPHFDYELTYEINKKLVKRLRVNNTSLKVDCYTVDNGREDRIGYIFLNLKQLQIVFQGGQIIEAWHRVLGVNKEARVLGPQLLLSFYITDIPKDNLSSDVQPRLPIWKKLNEAHPLTVSVKEDEGIIQIGPNKTCKSLFTLTMNVTATENINQLIDKDVESGVSIVYTMLGYSIQTKPVSQMNGTFLPNETIVIHLRSTLKYLCELTEPLKVDLGLMFGDEEIGTSYFLLEDLSQDLKKTIEKRCILSSPKLDSTITPELQPWLQVAVCFARENKPSKKTMDLRTIETHKCRDEDGKKPNRSDSQHITARDQKGQTTSMPSVRLNLTSVDKPCPKTAPGGSTYRAQKDEGPLQNYVLTVALDSLQLSEEPVDKKVSFRFHHSDAVIKTIGTTTVNISDINTPVNFDVVQAEFYFKLPANIHQSCLISQPPKVIVCDEQRELASTLLHLGILFSHDQKKCSYTAVLDDEGHNKGLLGITMSLDEVGGHTQLQPPSEADLTNAISPIVDEQLMLKVVEELEDWKEKQQDIFRAELMRKEQEYLTKVAAEWEEKKRSIEQTLIFNVENSQNVLDSLNKATEDLRLQELSLKEKEMKLQHEKEELKRKFCAKTQEMRIASQRMKDEHTLKTSAAILEKVENLEKQIKTLEKERDALEKKVNMFEVDSIKNKETFLNKEQAEAILKEMENLVERFEKEKQSKIFYKTEWGKSVREQRKLKKLYDDILKKHLERNNEELRLLSIHQIASDHDKALQEDQLRLIGLKNEVLSWNKGQGDSGRSIGTDAVVGSLHSDSHVFLGLK